MSTAISDHDGLNEKLLAAVPGVGQVLELGCADGRLGRRYKELHPNAHWCTVDLQADAVALDIDGLPITGSGYEAVVIHGLLERLKDPERVLSQLREVTTADARLVCCVPNMSHSSVLERILAGDITYDDDGLLDRTHVRFFSPASLFKTLLDSGWLPNLADHHSTLHSNKAFEQALVAAGAALGIPKKTLQRNVYLRQMIVDCTKAPDVQPFEAPPFTVIAAVNRDNQLQANLLHSPGLGEVDAHVMLYRDARSPADAFEHLLPHVPTPWVIYAHQDVYFPKTSGYAISRLFASIPQEQAADTLIGFAGMARDDRSQPRKAGLAIDRMNRFDFPESDRGIALDEFAVAFHQTTRHRIDPMLGWHLWATDLCLAAAVGGRALARIARIPLFHNSFGDYDFPAGLHVSARQLGAKYPTMPIIPTLHGNIEPTAPETK